MTRLSMLVTSDGQWVLEDSGEFLEALGDPDPDYDSVLFAVKNLGFIRFQIIDEAVIEVELHPRNVELPALLAVQQQLLSQQAKLIRIKFFDIAWRSEITSGCERAITRLSELCTQASTPTSTERFFIEPQDYSQLFNTGGDLQLMAQKWRMSFARFDHSVIPFAVQHRLLSRLMIVGVKPPGADPVFRFIGDGFNWTDDAYQFDAIGQRVQHQPDRDYGGWVSEFYKAVALTGEPRYDRVTAVVPQPRLGKPRNERVSYERLLLPWKTSSDEILVTLSSKMLGDAASPKAASRSEPESSNVIKLARSS